MWWWTFNKEEPLQEDLVVYEKFMELKEDRERMNLDKERQKADRELKKSGSSVKYQIPDYKPER